MSSQSKTFNRSILLSLALVLAVACSDTGNVAGSTTQPPVTSNEQGDLVHASVALDDDLEVGESEIPLLVTYGGCTGGLVPQEIESIEVEEEPQTVRIEVLVRLPLRPFPTTCPENPTIEHTIELESPLGDRTIEVADGERTFILWPTNP